jgi:hypothetical protein
MLPFLVPVLFTFYIQGVLKNLKKSGAKRLKKEYNYTPTPSLGFRGMFQVKLHICHYLYCVIPIF